MLSGNSSITNSFGLFGLIREPGPDISTFMEQVFININSIIKYVSYRFRPKLQLDQSQWNLSSEMESLHSARFPRSISSSLRDGGNGTGWEFGSIQ